MTLRTRIAAVAGLAVAVAVLLAAVVVYVAVRSDLRGQVDASLRQRAAAFAALPPPGAPGTPGTPAEQAATDLVGGGGPPTRAAGLASFPTSVAPGRFGGPSGFVQFIDPTGAVDVPSGQGSSPTIAPNSAERAIAARGRGRLLADRTVRGTHLRVLTLGAGPRGAVLVALPLTTVDHELSHILLILALVGVAGIALAVLLGALVARTALTPIARFTRRTEQLTGDPDLSRRLEVSGRDELARLAVSFNATLEELERSVAAQRHLIADAGHELRTPIASLRANIQVLQDAAPPYARGSRGAATRHHRRARRAHRARQRRRRARPRQPRRAGSRRRAPRRDRRRRRRAHPPALRSALRGLAAAHGRARRGRAHQPRRRQPARQRTQVEPSGRPRRGASCATASFRPRPRPRLPRGRSPPRLRALLPRRVAPAACRAPAWASRSCAKPPRPTTGTCGPRTPPAAARGLRSASGHRWRRRSTRPACVSACSLPPRRQT